MTREGASYRGDDRLLLGIILGVLASWLFAQTTLNIAPAMATDLEVATNVMNIAVSITALFSDNVVVRQAALIALAFNLFMVVAAIVSIMLTVPEGRKRYDAQ